MSEQENKSRLSKNKVIILGSLILTVISLIAFYPFIYNYVNQYDSFTLSIHGCNVVMKYDRFSNTIETKHDAPLCNVIFDKDWEQIAFKNILIILETVLLQDYENDTHEFQELIVKHGYGYERVMKVIVIGEV